MIRRSYVRVMEIASCKCQVRLPNIDPHSGSDLSPDPVSCYKQVTSSTCEISILQIPGKIACVCWSFVAPGCPFSHKMTLSF